MRSWFIVIGIFLLIVFAVFSREVKRGAMKQVDFAVTVKIQEKIDNSSRLRTARLVEEIMEGSTFLASPLFSMIIIAVITIIKLLKDKSLRSLAIPAFFALLVVAEMYGKSVVHHPAPPFFMIKNPTTIFPKYYINEQFSYPSGHAARAVFLGLVFYSSFIIHHSSFTKKTIRFLTAVGVIGFIGLVSISRIYFGHHWLSDVLGGWILGSATGLFVAVLLI